MATFSDLEQLDRIFGGPPPVTPERMYDFWLGGIYAPTIAELIKEFPLDEPLEPGPLQPHHWMAINMVPTGTSYYWPRLSIS